MSDDISIDPIPTSPAGGSTEGAWQLPTDISSADPGKVAMVVSRHHSDFIRVFERLEKLDAGVAAVNEDLAGIEIPQIPAPDVPSPELLQRVEAAEAGFRTRLRNLWVFNGIFVFAVVLALVWIIV